MEKKRRRRGRKRHLKDNEEDTKRSRLLLENESRGKLRPRQHATNRIGRLRNLTDSYGEYESQKGKEKIRKEMKGEEANP